MLEHIHWNFVFSAISALSSAFAALGACITVIFMAKTIHANDLLAEKERQEKLEDNRRLEKNKLFSQIFVLRGQPDSPEFLKALNFVSVAFRDDEAVLSDWKKLHKVLSVGPFEPTDYWLSLAKLLKTMAKNLGRNAFLEIENARWLEDPKCYNPPEHIRQKMQQFMAVLEDESQKREFPKNEKNKNPVKN